MTYPAVGGERELFDKNFPSHGGAIIFQHGAGRESKNEYRQDRYERFLFHLNRPAKIDIRINANTKTSIPESSCRKLAAIFGLMA